MSVNRTTVLKEPGLVQFNSLNFFPKSPITVDFIEPKFPVESDAHGELSKRPEAKKIEVKFIAVGELENLGTLFPHGGLTHGASLFGATDTACTIFTRSGKSLTLHNAAITKMPALNLGHKVTLFGEVVITGLVKNSTDINEANSFYTWANSGATYPGDSDLSVSAIKTLSYLAAWGASSPWDEFSSAEGFTLEAEMDLKEEEEDTVGIYDITLNKITAKITGTPVGITVNDLLAKHQFQGSGNELGAERGGGDDLIITNAFGSTQIHVQLYGAILDDTTNTFSGKEKSVGELTWEATREFVSGSPSPLFYVGTSAPS